MFSGNAFGDDEYTAHSPRIYRPYIFHSTRYTTGDKTSATWLSRANSTEVRWGRLRLERHERIDLLHVLPLSIFTEIATVH